MIKPRHVRAALTLGFVLIACSSATAQDGSNVLVVVNRASDESKQIADRYVQARRIPPENVLLIATDTRDEIERRRYDVEIELPIAEWISKHSAQDRILYIVLTKGVPLRIVGSLGLQGTSASVDSELTLLYRKLLGTPVAPAGRVANPYFLGDRALPFAVSFSHESHDIYLVTRIDAFSLADAFRLIADGASPVADGKIVLDQRATTSGDSAGDGWLAEAAARLSPGREDRVMLDGSAAAVTGQEQVLGYYSWGSNDPAIRRRRLDLRFVPGSIAAMFVSTDGRTFREPPDSWRVTAWGNPATYFSGSPQSLAGDLIREGATGVAAHVAEPFLDAAVRPQVLFPAYVSGFNLAESFYLSMPYLSWQNLVVGDPLCRPFGETRLSREKADPDLNAETELPQFFSARRLAILTTFGVRAEVASVMLKANARLIHGDLAGAQSALEAATSMEPGLNAAHFVLAGIYDQSGEYDKAIERYRRILSTVPGDVRSLNNLAYLLATRKNAPAEALPLAFRAREIASKGEILIDLGYVLIARAGTPAASLPFGASGYNAGALRAQIADTLGWIYHQLGDEDNSVRLITEAVSGNPDNAVIRYHLAAVEAARGRTAEAKDALSLALTLDPSLEKDAQVAALRAELTNR